MEHLVKLLRDSYDLQEEKSEESAYWHLQQLRSEIKQLTLTDVSQQRELLNALADEFNDSTHTYVGQPLIEKILKAFNCG
tara:strand:+ start:108 stop:347 length:240 start_codon:yes stop_codon:yes gene_type:complete